MSYFFCCHIAIIKCCWKASCDEFCKCLTGYLLLLAKKNPFAMCDTNKKSLSSSHHCLPSFLWLFFASLLSVFARPCLQLTLPLKMDLSCARDQQ